MTTDILSFLLPIVMISLLLIIINIPFFLLKRRDLKGEIEELNELLDEADAWNPHDADTMSAKIEHEIDLMDEIEDKKSELAEISYWLNVKIQNIREGRF